MNKNQLKALSYGKKKERTKVYPFKPKSFKTKYLEQPHAIIQSVSRLKGSDIVNVTEYCLVILKKNVYGTTSKRRLIEEIEIPKKVMKKIDLDAYKPVMVCEEGMVYERTDMPFKQLLNIIP